MVKEIRMKKLYRSKTDEMIGGVCGGLAEYLGVDPTIIRLAFVILFFAGTGGFWLYIILWIVMPPAGKKPGSIEVAEKKPASEAPQTIEVKPVEDKPKKE